jgi:hypothetical protein
MMIAQPAYHSKFNDSGLPEACSCAICPIKTDLKGPAGGVPPGLYSFNLIFRNAFLLIAVNHRSVSCVRSRRHYR